MNEGVQDGLASNRLHELLIGVKATVEGLLATQSTNVWSTYGGLDRLCNNVEAVLMHQIILDQITNPGAHDYWPFILGLRWLRPLPASCIEQYLGPGALVPRYGQQGGASYPTTHAHGYGFTEEPSRGGAWLRHSLLNHNLSTQLQILLSDESYVAQHYNEDAFLRQSAHVHALVICLQAVEQNEPTLLAELDPSLLLNKPLHNKTGDSRRYTTGSLHKPAYRKTKHHDQERRKDEPLPVREVKETERTESTDQNELALQPESNKPRLVRSVSLPTILTPINSEERYNKTDNILLTSNSDMLTIVSNSSDHIGGHHHAFKTLRRNNTESRLGCTGSLPLLAFSAHLIGPTPAQLHTSQECVQIPELSSSPSKLARKALVQALHNSGEETAFCDTEVKVLPESDVPDGVRMRRDSYNDELLSAEVSTCTELPPLVEKQSDIIETADNLENASTSSKSLLHSNNMDGINESTIPEGCSADRVYQPRGSLHAEVSLLDVDEDGASNVEHDVKPSAEATHITNKQSSLYHKKIKHVRSMSDYGISDFQRQNEASGHNVDSMTRSVTGDHLDTNSLPHNLPLSYKHKERSGTMESLFQQPSKGQSLIGFLSSQDFHTCAELDKENAHFSICETLISAIEQIKCKQMQQSSVPAGPAEENMEGDSDEEIQDLKQRIRIRRRERLKEKAHEFPVLNDNKGEISVCSSSPQHSASQISRSYQSDIDVSDSEQFYSSESGSSSGDDILDAELSDREEDSCAPVSNLSSMKQSGLSLSMASMYSDADLRRNLMSPESLSPKNIAMTESNSSMSAEYIAISLLRKFSETQLPKASELQWLVSEKDTGQTLLPLPNSYPVSPDDETQIDQSTRLRGNMEWAPPRPQIIFNIHPAPKRKLILAKQNQRCAGCGARVETGYTKRYHYCDYLGKYFCPRCHTNSMAYIPARIVRRWDHTKRPVSNFARDLLSKVADDPLYDVYNINPTLNHKVKDLDVATECRQQLSHLSLFLQTCKQGQTLYEELKGLPSHWLNDITVYSLNELLQLKKKELVPQLKSLVMRAVQHVQKCQLCQARGFICELCEVNDIIYPYQLQTVVQCADCRTCFHRNCYVPGKCPKCARIEARKQMLANQHNQYDSYESSEEDT